ncbi:alpha/beta fold hydrolase [Glycomyces luteolus]|uniref:Alpha/beta fold hydrolase n=1 Tax=Glycomyces luteolus TaxID=2670330 RepID=A0A9X3PCK6_9ACTN|nr:alpha/beta fold hydrolase [Glycomyces luteolus]MDA1361307.1 alpha/beta fold hydrolase [Glycomyces luteolus]
MTNISSQRPALTTEIHGSGPGIVLAHGGGGRIDSNFGPLIPLLAQGHTVTASSYPADDTVLELDSLADALVEAAATERFTIIGFSLGTAVAVRAAARHPERVSGLILAAGIARADNRLRLALDLWRSLLAAGDRESFARFVLGSAFSADFVNGMPAADVAATVEQIAASIPGGTAAQAALIGTVDTTADLPGIAVPTLAISASEDLLVDPANHRFLAERIAGAEYAEVKAGHVFMAEQPDAWHGLVLDFLERHGL